MAGAALGLFISIFTLCRILDSRRKERQRAEAREWKKQHDLYQVRKDRGNSWERAMSTLQAGVSDSTEGSAEAAV